MRVEADRLSKVGGRIAVSAYDNTLAENDKSRSGAIAIMRTIRSIQPESP